MLASFCMKRTFYKLAISLYVDREKKQANLMVKYDLLIKRVDDTVSYADVDSPEKADAWLSRPVGQHSTLIEWLEDHYKREAASAAA